MKSQEKIIKKSEHFRLRQNISEKLTQLSDKYPDFNKTNIVEMALTCFIQADNEGLLGEFLDRYYFNRREKGKLSEGGK